MSCLNNLKSNNWQCMLSRQGLAGGGLLFTLLFIGLASYHRLPPPIQTAAMSKAVAEVTARVKQLPVYFIENQGQSDAQVAYYVQGRDTSAYFTAGGITLTLQEPRSAKSSETQQTSFSSAHYETTQTEGARKRWAVKVEFVGGASVKPHGVSKTSATINYFKGRQSDWKTGLPTYADVVYPEVWPGIDIVYSGDSGRIKATFQVQPGTDPGQIQLAYQGVSNVTLTDSGRLSVKTPVGGFEEDTPLVYQEIAGQYVPVEARYTLTMTNTGEWRYGFDLGNYDRSYPLFIDPAILVYSGFIGGNNQDYAKGVAVDGLGQAYVVGDTYSTESSFPVHAGPVLTYGGGLLTDAFVVKVSADGTQLVYAGYIGGNDIDSGNGVAVDNQGQAYVVGTTQSSETSFPVKRGPDISYNGNGGDAFVAKITADGSQLIYAGYIGGVGLDSGNGIAVDSSGQAYIIGHTYSSQTTFPVQGGPDLTFNGAWDAFMAKVSTDGGRLVYAGYIGGASADAGRGIAVDSLGQAYVVGSTSSTETSFPVHGGPGVTYSGGTGTAYDYAGSFVPGGDAFVAKVSADGSQLIYAGYIGGDSTDHGMDIAVDGLGQAYIVGTTLSTETSFPVRVGPDLTSNKAADNPYWYDAFVAKVSADGTKLVYAGYIGGSSYDYGSGIAVDSLGQAYVAGWTTSNESSFPVRVGPDITYNGGPDEGFVAKVSADGTQLVYSGFIGGNANDYANDVAVDSLGQAYVVGGTYSGNLPVISGPDLTFDGSNYPTGGSFNGGDAFIAKLSQEGPSPRYMLTTTKSGLGSGTVTSTPPGIDCGITCNASFLSGTTVTLAATPTQGSSFTGWSGACSGTGNCQVGLNAASNVTANFVPNYALTVTNQNPQGGKITSNDGGINCGNTCSQSYAIGTVVTLTATPVPGYGFAGWEGSCTGASTTCQVTLDQARAVIAHFNALPPARLTVSKIGGANGTVTSSPPGINCGATCSADFPKGATVTLAVKPEAGYLFMGWGGVCSSPSLACTLTLDAAKNVTAGFSPLRVTEQQSIDLSIAFLRDRMDEFHTRLPIYDDVSSAGNHFNAYGAIGKPANLSKNVTVNGDSSDKPHAGATCIRFSFTPLDSTDFGGFYMMNGVLPKGKTAPEVNFGTIPDAGLNIPGAKRLTFFARGQSGSENITFVFGGVGRNPETGVATASYPDSSPRRAITVNLTSQWQQYAIDLTGSNTSYVLGGFGWSAGTNTNPKGAVFYVDDINIELDAAGQQDRLSQPHFLRSFLTAPYQPNPFDDNTDDDIDFVLRNTAFTYDNALALMAFLAHGSDDSIRRARLIGDAFVYAANHDRYFTDGRIRTAYAAGDISLPPGWTPNGKTGTVPVAGFYTEYDKEGKYNPNFYEVEQDAVDTGNNAWAMIALLKLYQKTDDGRYRDAASRIGNFIHTLRNDFPTASYKGFFGGIMHPENPDNSSDSKIPPPTIRPYASVEHNLDIAAAFTVMHDLSGEPQWQTDAAHAKEFVDSMFDDSRGCYLAGTLASGITSPVTRNLNPWQLPVDVQAWAILALRNEIANRYTSLLTCAENYHRTSTDGFSGFDFNNDHDGVWFEGTGQVAVGYAFTGHNSEADAFRQTLRQAQALGVFGDPKGVSAASHDGLSTGFNTTIDSPSCVSEPQTCTFKYFQRQHLGATAWNVFAQMGFNPYYDLYFLTVFNQNPAIGTITSDLGGINCGTTCTANFTNKTVVTLTPQADKGWFFTGWSGACHGLGKTCQLTLDQAQSVTARFGAIRQDSLVVDFNSYGIYQTRFNAGWTKLHPLSASQIVPADLDGNGKTDLAVNFGSRYGVFDWMNSQDWFKLHELSPVSITAANLNENGLGDLAVNFGKPYGLWKWMDNQTWENLHELSPASVTAMYWDGNDVQDLLVDFAPYGSWLWINNQAWEKLHDLSFGAVATADLDGNGQEDLAVSFGPYGTWVMPNHQAWTKLHELPAAALVATDMDGNGQSDLVVSFPPYGLWAWMNNQSWKKLHDLSPMKVVAVYYDGNAKQDLAIDFASYGIWLRMNDQDWVKLHDLPARHIVAVPE